eukprot:1578029-Alexandrium_andersonii.AAC.1
MGLARLSPEDPYHSIAYRQQAERFKGIGGEGGRAFKRVSPQADELRYVALADVFRNAFRGK